jgi:sRNA-binding carbon storage regulator CsrA
MDKPPSLVVEVRPGEVLDLGGTIQVELLKKSGNAARLRVVAPREVKIERRRTGDLPGRA